MRYGIINAEQTEMDGLLVSIKNEVVTTLFGVDFHEGTIGSNEVVVVNGGIGKVAAALTATLLLSQFKIDRVINSGSAGALGDDLRIGDIVIANELAYFDADAQVFGYEYGQVPQQPARFTADTQLVSGLMASYQDQKAQVKAGLIVSGDTFINSTEQKQMIKAHFPTVQSGEMEGAAIAQVATQFKIPFAVVRAISDNANGEAGMSYDEFVIAAGEQSAKVLIDFLA